MWIRTRYMGLITMRSVWRGREMMQKHADYVESLVSGGVCKFSRIRILSPYQYFYIRD